MITWTAELAVGGLITLRSSAGQRILLLPSRRGGPVTMAQAQAMLEGLNAAEERGVLLMEGGTA